MSILQVVDLGSCDFFSRILLQAFLAHWSGVCITPRMYGWRVKSLGGKEETGSSPHNPRRKIWGFRLVLDEVSLITIT